MTCPYEKLQGVATSHYVPVEVTRPDGSQYRTMMKLSGKVLEKLQELSEDKNVKNREPNLQQLPMRTKDAKRIKEAFNPVPDAFDSPTMQQLKDAMGALERGEPVLTCGDFVDGSGVKVIDYLDLMPGKRQNLPEDKINVEVKDGVMHMSHPSGKDTEQAAAAELLRRIRDLREGDEMSTYEIDSLSDISGGEKMLRFSTPTGRTPTNIEEMLRRHKAPVVVGASWENSPIKTNAHLLEESYKIHPHQQAAMDAIKQQAFEQGYRAGLSGKPTLSMLAIQHQIERIKSGATPLIVCDERHPLVTDPLFGLEKLMGNLNFGMRFSPGGHIDSMGKTLAFDFETYGGDWFRKIRVMPDYENLKQDYMREDEYSKIKDKKERHEAICRKLVKPYKKRRKAVRKVLDAIGGELKA